MMEHINKRSLSFMYRGWKVIIIFTPSNHPYSYDFCIKRKNMALWSATTLPTLSSAKNDAIFLVDGVINNRGKSKRPKYYSRKREKREYLHRESNHV